MPITFDNLVDQMEQIYQYYSDPLHAECFIDGEIYALFELGYISPEERNIADTKNQELYKINQNNNNDD